MQNLDDSRLILADPGLDIRGLADERDDEELERTDIDSDERLDGDVDADGAAAILHRNE